MKDLSALILAAGKGTRMVSDRAKVLHPVCGVPMIRLIVRSVLPLDAEELLVVIGHDADRVQDCLKGLDVRFVLQREQLGTGHAVIAARGELERKQGDILVLFGDSPRLRTETLRRLVGRHVETGAAATLLTAKAQNPFGYGRILRDESGRIEAIVEERDADPEQRQICEVNPGFYCFRVSPLLEALDRLSNENAQGEYYITDLVHILRGLGERVETVPHDDFEELRGVNTRRELAEASRALRAEKIRALMEGGVTCIDPENTYVELEVEVEKDVTLFAGVHLEGRTRIRSGSVVRAGSRIRDSEIGPGTEILESCVVQDSRIGTGTIVGPFSHLRDGVVVGEECRIGNFVELKKTSMGRGCKAAHHAYLGDATIGNNVNIGAGTITCNYDGVRKHATIIEDDVFVGTDSQLVAPVRIGRGAYIAAGSCITEDVPAEALGIARSRQTVKPGWARSRRRQTP